MSLSINSNLASVDAQLNLSRSQSTMNQTMSQLSSGLRITTAADDPAGLGISTLYQSQVSSYDVAAQNTNDGISLLQTADGAMGQIQSSLERMRELAMQSANGTLASSDRVNLQAEFTALQSEVSRVADSTKFGSMQLLNAPTTINLQVGITTTVNDTISVGLSQEDAATLKVDQTSINVGDTTSAKTALTSIDTAIASLSANRASVGALQNRLSVAMTNDQTASTNLNAAKSMITDVDVAQASGNLAREQVLVQAGISVLAQANQQPNNILKLLQ